LSAREEILQKLAEAVINGDVDLAREMAKRALEAGIEPWVAITQGLSAGMKVVGDKYEAKEYFLPEVLMAADAMYAGLDVLLPHLKAEKVGVRGKIVLGVVEGDIHDIGKNIVKAMLTAAGFEVIDAGRDVPIEKFIELVEKEGAHVLGMSTMMTPTLIQMKRAEDMLRQKGLKDRVKTIIGGGTVTEEFRQRIGADAYGKDAVEAVDKVKALIESIMAAAELVKKEKKEEEKKE
jgi:corrinoid protein of di/trimethylamine methyltransferase